MEVQYLELTSQTILKHIFILTDKDLQCVQACSKLIIYYVEYYIKILLGNKNNTLTDDLKCAHNEPWKNIFEHIATNMPFSTKDAMVLVNFYKYSLVLLSIATLETIQWERRTSRNSNRIIKFNALL